MPKNRWLACKAARYGQLCAAVPAGGRHSLAECLGGCRCRQPRPVVGEKLRVKIFSTGAHGAVFSDSSIVFV